MAELGDRVDFYLITIYYVILNTVAWRLLKLVCSTKHLLMREQAEHHA